MRGGVSSSAVEPEARRRMHAGADNAPACQVLSTEEGMTRTIARMGLCGDIERPGGSRQGRHANVTFPGLESIRSYAKTLGTRYGTPSVYKNVHTGWLPVGPDGIKDAPGFQVAASYPRVQLARLSEVKG